MAKARSSPRSSMCRKDWPDKTMDMNNNNGKLSSFLKKHLVLEIAVFLLAAIYVIALLLTPYFMGKAIDASLDSIHVYGSPEWNNAVNSFWLSIGLMGGLSLVSAVAEFFFEYFSNKISQLIVKDIRDSVFEKLTYVPLSYIDNRPHGDMLSLASVDCENVMTGITGVFKQLLEGIFTLAFTLVFMFILNWILALVVLILTPLSFLVSKTVKKVTHTHFKAQAKTAGDLAGYTLERVRNYKTVRTFDIGEENQKNFEALDSSLYEEGRKSQFLSSWTNPSTRLVNNIVYTVIGLSGIVLVLFSSSANVSGESVYTALRNIGSLLTIGGFTTFLTYALKFAKPFNDISSVATEIQNAQASYKRIQTLLKVEDEREEDSQLEKGNVPAVKTIEFKSVEFGYEPGQHILKGLDLSVYAGHKVAIVGPTGCGKTTLINLLLRFYDPRSGKILLGGRDSKTLPKGKVRGLFGMVLQDTWIFQGTVKENIAYAKPSASLEEIKEAAKRAQADAFIERLPMKYDTVIASSSGLSEGEKQLISIARVLLMNPNMIILDEATSSLDAVSEKNITAAIAELSTNRTSIVIAHRLQTIINADAIAVMVNGKVGEIGTHQELMAKKGYYYSLYTSQYQ